MRQLEIVAPALVLGALACSSPPNGDEVTSPAAPVGASGSAAGASPRGSPLPDTSGAYVPVAVPVPAAHVLDGRLDDWGPAAARGAVVLVAVDDTRALVAVPWSAPPAGGVAIALSSTAPSFPAIGWAEPGGSTHALDDETCRFEQIALIEGEWKKGKAQPPEAVAACLEIVKRQREQATRYAERFVRRFRLAPAGVESLDAAGAATPIPGAKLASSERGVEVELPLSALPELAQAPLTTLRVAASRGALPPDLAPPVDDEAPGWTPLTLPRPVHFEPHGLLRARIYAAREESPRSGELSYHPAKPETLRLVAATGERVSTALGIPMGPNRPSVLESELPIFTELEKLGAVSVGLVRADHELLATYKGGQLVDTSSFFPVRARKQRGGDLHVFAYDPGSQGEAEDLSQPAWTVRAVKPSGEIDIVSDEGVDVLGVAAWDEPPKPAFDAELSALTLTGKYRKRAKTVTWRWEPAEGRYVSTVQPKDQAASSW